DGMREDLESPPVQFSNRALVFVGLPEQFPTLAGIIAVGRKHGCGMCLNNAVQHGLYRPARNPVIVISSSSLLDFFDGIRRELRRVEEVSDIKAESQFAIAAQFVFQVEPLKILDRTRDPTTDTIICI